MGKLTYSVKKKFGNNTYTFLIEGENFMDCIMEGRNLSFGDVDKCGLCGHTELELGAHVTKARNHKYVHLTCKKCRGQLNFGHREAEAEKNMCYLKTREEIVDNKKTKVLDWRAYSANSIEE